MKKRKTRRQQWMELSLPVRRYRRARGGLIGMILLTVVNGIQAAVGSSTYYLFSSYISYIFALYGWELSQTLGDQRYLIVGLVEAALVLIPFLLCWIFSKKRRGWLIAAFVLFCIDTAAVLVDAVTTLHMGYLLDLAFHIWLLVEMFVGIRSGKQALEEEKNPPQQEQDMEFHDASTGELPDTVALGMPQEERKYRVIVEAMHGSRTIQVRRSYGLTELVIDGRLYGKREGVMEMPYKISARVDGHEIATTLEPTNLQTIQVDGQVIAKKIRIR